MLKYNELVQPACLPLPGSYSIFKRKQCINLQAISHYHIYLNGVGCIKKGDVSALGIMPYFWPPSSKKVKSFTNASSNCRLAKIKQGTMNKHPICSFGTD